MSETTRPKRSMPRRRDERRERPSSKPAVRVGDMIHLVLITVGAACLTGVLALPFTLPGRVLAAPATGFGAAEVGSPARAPSGDRMN